MIVSGGLGSFSCGESFSACEGPACDTEQPAGGSAGAGAGGSSSGGAGTSSGGVSGSGGGTGGEGVSSNPCDGADDGDECNDGKICVEEACVTSTCGDGFTDTRTETCDDDRPGCKDCDLVCTKDEDCDDNNPCTTKSTCDTSAAECSESTAETGSYCDASDSKAEPTECAESECDICNAGTCTDSVCSDGIADPRWESCQPGDSGCNECALECTKPEDCASQVTTCGPTYDCVDNACVANDDAPGKGDSCRDGAANEICIAGDCDVSVCGDGYLDTDSARVSTPEECGEGGSDRPVQCTDCLYALALDGIYVRPDVGAAATKDGSPENPYATLSAAVAAASGAPGKTTVYLCADVMQNSDPWVYAERLVLGGLVHPLTVESVTCASGTWAGVNPTGSIKAIVRPNDKGVALSITGDKGGQSVEDDVALTLRGLHFIADKADQVAGGSANPAGLAPGESSIGGFIKKHNNVTLEGVTLEAARGANGEDGVAPTASNWFTPASEMVGASGDGIGGGGGAGLCVCQDGTTWSKGGGGANVPGNPVKGERNPAGASGDPDNAGTLDDADCVEHAGASGDDGQTGTNATTYGAWDQDKWSPGAGVGADVSAIGGPGQGGGGGARVTNYAGGGGGCGGCGGSPATVGGRGGGASAALVVLESRVGFGNGVTLVTKGGGTGGAGVKGQEGQGGGNGGSGAKVGGSGIGCPGGKGAKGGYGGHAGAGAGGLSVGVFFIGRTEDRPNVSSLTKNLGAPGAPGTSVISGATEAVAQSAAASLCSSGDSDNADCPDI